MFTMNAKRKRPATQQEIDSILIASNSEDDESYDPNDQGVMSSDNEDESGPEPGPSVSTAVGHDETQHCVWSRAASFLKGLPVYNEQNFSRFQGAPSGCIPYKKPPVYLPMKDNPCSHEIVTEKPYIFLRFFNQQWEKKCLKKKRETGSGSNEEEAPRNKRPRLEPSYLLTPPSPTATTSFSSYPHAIE